MSFEDRTTTYKEQLKIDQKILIYFRFNAIGKRFYKGIVKEIHDNYVIVESRGYLWKIGPEHENDKLFYDYDKRNDLYLTGPYGLHAEIIEKLYTYSFDAAYGGRVFIHPNAPDYWEHMR